MPVTQAAERWIETSLREHSRGAMLQALTYMLLALGGVVLWFGVTFGVLFMGSIVLAVLGIGLNAYKYIVIGVYVVQCAIYLFKRRKNDRSWSVSSDVDGNLVVIAPDSTDSSHGFVHRSVFASIFFCIPIALDEALQAIRLAFRIRQLDAEPLIRLTSILQDHERKVTFEDLSKQLGSETLQSAVTGATQLPGFQLFSGEPQGITLTSSAVDELVAA